MVMKKETSKRNKKCSHNFHLVNIFDNTFHMVFVKDTEGNEIQENRVANFICDMCGFHKSIGVIYTEE